MDFFDEVDSLGIVEQHIQGVLGLEDKKALVLLRRYREIRSELRDRLDYLPEGTFSSQQLRGVLTQVDAAISAMSISLSGGMQEHASVFALRGVEDGITELQKFERVFQGAVMPININRVLVAEETSNFLLNKYEASIQAYSADLRASLVGSLTNEALAESSLSSVVRRLGQFFIGEEWKLQRIARTEFHNIYNLGKQNSLTDVRDSTLPDLMKALMHPMDKRTGADSMYAAAQNLIVPLDEPFRYKWGKQERVFMTPPDRPNDRSIMVPYRKSWDQ